MFSQQAWCHLNKEQTCFLYISWASLYKTNELWLVHLISHNGIDTISFIIVVKSCCKFSKFIFDNPEGQWPMWAIYLHTRAMFNIWHWQR